MRRFFLSLLFLVLAAGFVLLGLWLSELGFHQIRKMRQVERVPPTAAVGVLPGEVNLQGRVRPIPDGRVLESPHFDRPCVYYRYTVEREERDSDGDTRWVTEVDRHRYVSFHIADGSGAIRVDPGGEVSFSVDLDQQVRIGNRRYSEYRLDPGDDIFCFGYAAYRPGGGLAVNFTEEGYYTPILSQAGELGERRGMATASVFACWGGLVALSLSVVFLMLLLRFHRIIVYLILVALVLAGGLVYYGLRMMEADLRGAHDRLEHHRQSAVAEYHRILDAHDIEWDDDWETVGRISGERYATLDAPARERLRRIRIDLWRAIERTNAMRQRFPESLFAEGWGIGEEPQIALHETAIERARELDSSFRPATLSPLLAWIVGALGGLLAFFLTRWGFRSVQTKRHIEHMPTIPTTAAAWGPMETVGTAATINNAPPLTGPLSGRDCVQYYYREQERRGSGKNAKWVTLYEADIREPFLCVDQEGSLPVHPSGAEIITRHSDSSRRGRRRYEERRIEPGDELYLLGYAVGAPPDHSSLQLTKSKDDFPFLVANMSEQAVLMRKAHAGLWLLDLALAASVLVGLIAFGAFGSFQATDYLMAALIAPAYLLMVFVVMMFNDLVFLRNRVKNTWSNIDVALKKRYDLIPNLESVVKQYMAHERGLQEKLAQLRTEGRGGGSATALLPAFSASIEDYPQLQADANARHLMQQLIRVENDIALMRQSYNQAVERYNTKISQIPEVFLAKPFGFRPAELYRADFEVHTVPSVSFEDAEPEKPEGKGTVILDKRDKAETKVIGKEGTDETPSSGEKPSS